MTLSRLSWISLSKFVTGVALIAASLFAFASDKQDCSARLTVKFELFNDNFVRANGIVVTGDFLYPLATILENFGLKEKGFAARYNGRTALTIAEGVSDFLPFLLQNGIKAHALDVWYHIDHFPDNFSGTLMREYNEKYRENLVRGEAEHIPAEDGSIDMVFIHMLLNNKAIDTEKTKRILSEVIRVLSTREDARIVGFKEADIPVLREFLTEKFGKAIQFEFKEVAFTLGVFAGMEKESDILLTIKKQKAP